MRSVEIAVVGLEDQRFVARHVGEPMPTVRGIMGDDDSLEGPFRLGRRVEYGVSLDQFHVERAREAGDDLLIKTISERNLACAGRLGGAEMARQTL